MKITVVGAILIIVGVIIVVMILGGPPDGRNRGSEQNNPKPGDDLTGPPGV